MEFYHDKVQKIIEEHLTLLTYDMDMNLFHCGLDSITAMKIIIDIEEKLNVSIDETNIRVDNFRTPNSIICFIKSSHQIGNL